MIDIVIPLAKSKIDFLDLRYCLRGIEKYVPHRNIYIIGEKPSWIKNVLHIKHEDHPNEKFKERNIYNKILKAFSVEGISDDVWFHNDDHLIIDELPTPYPNYYKGALSEAIMKNTGSYKATMLRTCNFLLDNGKNTLNFDTHTPIVYNRDKFYKAFENVKFDEAFGYGIKSIYANMNDIKGEFMEDCKLRTKLTLQEVESITEGKHIVSCTDAPMKYGLGEYLKNKFMTKSKFEI